MNFSAAGKPEREQGKLPLFEVRVLVTRARQQAGKLSAGLVALGATPVEVPLLEIGPPSDFSPLDVALGKLNGFDWLLFTSANTVRAVAERAEALRLALEQGDGLKVAAVGPATAEAARAAGWRVDLVPEAYVAEGLIDALGEGVAGKKILLARAEVARDALPDGLRAAGGLVEVVEAYANRLPDEAPEQLRRAFSEGVDAATFTSSSSASHLAEAMRASGLVWPPAGVPAISIGPVTSRTLRELGWEPVVEAAPHDIPALLAALVFFFTSAAK